jgi:hypothetical protein
MGAGTGGCSSSSVINIGMLPPLSLSVSQTSYTTCIISNSPMFSAGVTLMPLGAGSYTWISLGQNPIVIGPGQSYIVRPSSSSCYTVIGATAICSGTAVSCVTVVPQFSISVLPTNPIRCLPDSVKLQITNVGATAVGPSSLFTYWWTEPVSSAISLSSYSTPTVVAYPSANTTYTAVIFDANNCISMPSFVTVSVSAACDGIKETDLEHNVIIYPNPVRDKLLIHSDAMKVTDIEITDFLGDLIFKQKLNYLNGALPEIPVSQLSPGIYFIKMGNGTSTISKRFLKE